LAAFDPVVHCDDLHQLHAWLLPRVWSVSIVLNAFDQAWS
jgi:hypothetical protein